MPFPAKVFLNPNIVLDPVTRREPFFVDVENLFSLAVKGGSELYISPDSFTPLAYFLNKYHSKQDTVKHLIQFKTIVTILPVNEKVIDLALVSKAADFEDTVQIAVAETNGMNCIVTRNIKDFSQTILAVFDPKLFLKSFN